MTNSANTQVCYKTALWQGQGMMRHEGGTTLRRSAALQSSGRTESRCLGGSPTAAGSSGSERAGGLVTVSLQQGEGTRGGGLPIRSSLSGLKKRR